MQRSVTDNTDKKSNYNPHQRSENARKNKHKTPFYHSYNPELLKKKKK